MPLRLTVPSIYPTECEQTRDGVWHWQTDQGDWELRLDRGFHFRLITPALTRELLLQPLTLKDAVAFSWGYSFGFAAGLGAWAEDFYKHQRHAPFRGAEGGD